METTRLRYSVEETVRDGWPTEYDKRLPAWAQQDAELMHTPPTLSPPCGLCRAIAEHSGVNLEPPEAA